MGFSIVKERLILLKEALKRDALHDEGLWRLGPHNIRFVIRDIHGNLKVPYVIGSKDLELFRNSILELSYYIKNRVEEKSSKKDLEKLFPSKLSGEKRDLPPLSYRYFPSEVTSLSRDEFASLVFSAPIFDTGILRMWFGRNGSGHRLIDGLRTIYAKSLTEEVRLEGKERTTYITHLVILNSLKNAKGVIKDIKIKGLSYERMEFCFGMILYLILKKAMAMALDHTKKGFPLYKLDDLEFLLHSTLTPGSFVYIREGLLKLPFNPYLLNAELFARLQELYKRLNTTASGLDIEGLLEGMYKKVKSDKGLIEPIVMTKRTNLFRKELIRYLTAFDDQSVNEHKLLGELVRDDKQLYKVFDDENYNKRVISAIDALMGYFPYDRERLAYLKVLKESVEPGKGWFRGSRLKKQLEEKDFKEVITAYLLYRFDLEIERKLSPWLSLVSDKRSESTPEEIKKDYERGRVYRFSTDSISILKKPKVQKEGYLFIDMKDFTRKTFRAKEVSMAEFMKARFFKPIIDVASSYGLGRDMVEEGMGVRLNNLLGDAIIFSGNISYLIYLAENIQAILDQYHKDLARQYSPDILKQVTERIKKTYEEAKGRASSLSSEGRESLIDFMDEEAEIEGAYREELEDIKSKEMMAGLYISYGTKAEQVSMRDNFWGVIDVAIGEKINEAARGVGRNSVVKAYLDLILERKRNELKKPSLVLPFSVYIGRTYNITIEPTIAQKIEESLVNKLSDVSFDVAQSIATGIERDIKIAISSNSFKGLQYLKPSKEIYNIGHAISEDALRAFIEETKSSTLHFRKKVAIPELHPEIKDKFLFLEDYLDLVISVKRGFQGEDVFVFRRVGRLAFKGFELGGAVTVYEILKKDTDFFKLVYEHHISRWIEEAFKKLGT